MFAKWVNTDECKNIHGYLCFMELRQLHEFAFQIFHCLLPFNLLCFFCFSSLCRFFLQRGWTLSKVALYTSISVLANQSASFIIIYTHFKTTEKNSENKKWPRNRAAEPASQLAHLVVIATHEFNFIYICKLFHYNFSAVRMSSLSSFACRAALNLGELTNLTVDKKHSHALYHHGRLYWYDMILFFLSRFQHFSFPVTEQSRSGKRVNQRKSGRKKMAERADAKRKIKQCKWKQSSAEQSQMQYHICVIVIQPLCAWFFFNFSTHFSRAVCVCVRVSENFNKPTLLYSHYSYMCVRFFYIRWVRREKSL